MSLQPIYFIKVLCNITTSGNNVGETEAIRRVSQVVTFIPDAKIVRNFLMGNNRIEKVIDTF